MYISLYINIYIYTSQPSETILNREKKKNNIAAVTFALWHQEHTQKHPVQTKRNPGRSGKVPGRKMGM
jgi:hypothetical protein